MFLRRGFQIAPGRISRILPSSLGTMQGAQGLGAASEAALHSASHHPASASSPARQAARPFSSQRRGFAAGAAPEVTETAIEQALRNGIEVDSLVVRDVSGGCGSFFHVTLASGEFKGLSTLKQHMMLNKLLKDYLPLVHGIQYQTSAVE